MVGRQSLGKQPALNLLVVERHFIVVTPAPLISLGHVLRGSRQALDKCLGDTLTTLDPKKKNVLVGIFALRTVAHDHLKHPQVSPDSGS